MKRPGAANDLSAATMVNATGEPLSVPDPVRVSVRDLVKGSGSDLRGVKIDARAGIGKGRASSWLAGIVISVAELGPTAFLAI